MIVMRPSSVERLEARSCELNLPVVARVRDRVAEIERVPALRPVSIEQLLHGRDGRLGLSSLHVPQQYERSAGPR